MRLCDRDIYQHLQDGKIKIDPTPSYDQISGVTVDIRLGNKFRVFEDHQAPFIDLSGPKAQVQEALDHVMSDEIELEEENYFTNDWSFDITEDWAPSESAFKQADEDVKDYDLSFDFIDVEDLYLEETPISTTSWTDQDKL